MAKFEFGSASNTNQAGPRQIGSSLEGIESKGISPLAFMEELK
jgi:hypothetical protein